MRVSTISVAVIFALTCVYCLIFFKVSDYCNGKLQYDKKRTIYGYVTGTVFLIDSVGLLYWTFRLIHMLKSDFKNSLKSERNLLNCLFVLYTLSYTIRAVFLFLQGSFSNLYNDSQKVNPWFVSQELYFNSFYIWDLLPIFVNLYLHNQNFSQRSETQSNQGTGSNARYSGSANTESGFNKSDSGLNEQLTVKESSDETRSFYGMRVGAENQRKSSHLSNSVVTWAGLMQGKESADDMKNSPGLGQSHKSETRPLSYLL